MGWGKFIGTAGLFGAYHAATGAGYFLHKKITGSNVFTFDPVLMIYLMFSDVPIQYPVQSWRLQPSGSLRC